MSLDAVRARAVAVLDPVDESFFNQAGAINESTEFRVPAFVIGAGRSGSCAPPGENHEKFYNASASPAWHSVFSSTGHADFYNDDCNECGLIKTVCEQGDDPAETKRITAGMLVLFFRAALQGDSNSYALLVQPPPSSLPIQIEYK
jgi:hypothetical protein